MRVCSVVGCPNIYARAEGSRCPKHRTEAKKKHWEKTRAYSTKGHRQFRSAVLTADPVCVVCQVAQSTVADHHPRSRRELEELGLNPNDPRYGRGVCKPCHDRSTAEHYPAGWNAR